MKKENYFLIDEVDVIECIMNLLDYYDLNVCVRVCNVIGNVCRYDDFFYEEFRDVKTLEKFIEWCGDWDWMMCKFVMFVIGNVVFYFDVLYGLLIVVVDLFMYLFDVIEEAKTRSNACVAFGNLVCNLGILCDFMVNFGVFDVIINLMFILFEVVGDFLVDVEVVKIVVYVFGNVCRYRACRERVASRKLKFIFDDFVCCGDDMLKKYVFRVKNKFIFLSVVL